MKYQVAASFFFPWSPEAEEGKKLGEGGRPIRVPKEEEPKHAIVWPRLTNEIEE